MSSRNITRTVYAWVRPDWQALDAPRTLPALRLWGDVILELVAESQGRVFEPPVAIRRTALFAWTTPVPPEPAARAMPGRRRVEVSVRIDQCGAAQMGLVDELLDPASWHMLRGWLIDRGHEADFIEEDVAVFADPMAAMLVVGARDAVLSTSPDLLDDIVSYFRPVAERYLATWSTLSTADGLDAHEVIAPAEAIVSVTR
jgi:hypothetical protein